MNGRERFLSACGGQPVDRAPVWLMRQAGRYLPEYRELRAQASFLELCADPARATEISVQPHRRFGMDGVVVFSDILIPLAGLGVELHFDPGPVVRNPVQKSADLERLDGDVEQVMEPTCEAIRRLKRELGEEAAIIGFAGAPWTLAAYACEERLSRDVEHLMGLSYSEPELVDQLLDRMAEVSAAALRVQMEAGADVLQIFDTWAGMLSVGRFERLAGRALQRVFELLPPNRPPLIIFARGASHLLESIADIGPDVVSLDWRTDLAEAAHRVGERVSLQGNLEPAALKAPPEQIEAAVAELVRAGRAARGHILNLGHGVLPSVPIEGVAAFVRAAQRARP